MRLAPIAPPCLVACANIAPLDAPTLDDLDPVTRAQVDWGRALFFDPGLSGRGDVSCASCHAPELHGADGLPTSVGTDGAVVRRNSPSVLNAALKFRQFWDGRAETLEEQARGPLFAADEMGQTEAGLLDHVATAWPDAWAAAFPDADAPTVDHVTAAIAAYERVLPTPSRVDRFLQGDPSALTEAESRGLDTFRANCAFCHGGEGVGGQQFRVLGDDVPWPAERSADLGRFEVTGVQGDRLVFVVPSLRNVAETGPWFHDGSVQTLEEAVRLMAKHQIDTAFTDREVDDLVAFLGALTAEALPPWAWPPDAEPRLARATVGR